MSAHSSNTRTNAVQLLVHSHADLNNRPPRSQAVVDLGCLDGMADTTAFEAVSAILELIVAMSVRVAMRPAGDNFSCDE